MILNLIVNFHKSYCILACSYVDKKARRDFKMTGGSKLSTHQFLSLWIWETRYKPKDICDVPYQYYQLIHLPPCVNTWKPVKQTTNEYITR